MANPESILARCSKGYLFQNEVRRAIGAPFGSIIYCDRATGTDNNDGDSWDRPVSTLNQASNKCSNYTNDVIIFRARVTGSQKFANDSVQELNKQGIHLYGAAYLYGQGGGQDSCIMPGDTPTSASNGTALAHNVCALNLGQNDIEVAGLKFFGGYSELDTNVWMLTNDNNRGIGHSIHHNIFCGDTDGGATSADGIGLIGAESVYVGYNLFRMTKTSITIAGDQARYANGGLYEHNRFQSPKYAVYLYNSSVTENLIEDAVVVPKTTIGHALTTALICASGSSGNVFKECVVYHATEGNAIADSGTNVFDTCRYGTTDGALTTYS